MGTTITRHEGIRQNVCVFFHVFASQHALYRIYRLYKSLGEQLEPFPFPGKGSVTSRWPWHNEKWKEEEEEEKKEQRRRRSRGGGGGGGGNYSGGVSAGRKAHRRKWIKAKTVIVNVRDCEEWLTVASNFFGCTTIVDVDIKGWC
eukprot:jgi/Botrbrau1/22538/Bobra.114_2s0062.1